MANARAFLNRFASPAIAAVPVGAGAPGTFNRNLIRASSSIDVSRINKPKRKPRRRRHNKRRGFRMGAIKIGAMRGSNMSAFALAAAAVGVAMVLKRH